MVGVAGRSKGCHTCKKRRVKCDESKPECHRCLRAGYICAGKPRRLHATSSSSDHAGAEGVIPGYARDRVFLITTSTTTPTTKPELRRREPPKINQEISLIAFAPTIQHTYLFTNFVWSTYGSPWLQASVTGALGPLAQKTTLAFAQTTFARHHHSHDIAVAGAKMYGEVVTSVRWGLSGRNGEALAALLAPVTILLMYAASVPSAEREGTANHVMGLFALLQMAGPKAFRRRPLRDAFSSCRATLVICGLLQKKRLFLEEEEWRVVPWELEPESKGEQDRLVDVLVFVPGFLEDQTMLLEMPDEHARLDLLRRVVRALRMLFAWRWAWEARNPDAVWEQPRTPAQRGAIPPPRVAGRFLAFSSFTAAVEIALYNAVLLCLLGLLFSELPPQQAQANIALAVDAAATQSPSRANMALNVPCTPMSLQAAAIEIVRAFEYQLRHARSTHESALFWLFPFGLAAKVLQDDLDMWSWIQQMLDESDVTRGYGRGDNAFGFGMYNLPKVDERTAELPNESIMLTPNEELQNGHSYRG